MRKLWQKLTGRKNEPRNARRPAPRGRAGPRLEELESRWLPAPLSGGTLVQFDAAGAHVLGSGVLSAGVAFGPAGEVLVATFASTASVGLDNANPHNLVLQDTTPFPGQVEAPTIQADTANQQYVISDPNTFF